MKVLNRDVIKYIAIALMFMDHTIQLFMERGTFQYNLLDSLSHFTFVTMSFFLVEGYYHTKSKRAYLKRIFLFAMISQVPYGLVLVKGIIPFNIFFTLGFCFLMICALERVHHIIGKVLLVLVSVIVCSLCDWMFFAPIITLGFWFAKGNKKKLVLAYVFDVLICGLSNISGYLVRGDFLGAGVQLLIGSSGIVLSGICMLVFYNGKCMKKYRVFHKWFFYLFYPLHFVLLGLIQIVMFGI